LKKEKHEKEIEHRARIQFLSKIEKEKKKFITLNRKE
jgi:hypothetical protein